MNENVPPTPSHHALSSLLVISELLLTVDAIKNLLGPQITTAQELLIKIAFLE